MTNLIKQITNGRLLKNNGSWMYCSQCDKTVGYLCYSTYLQFEFNFKCNCGNVGNFQLSYAPEKTFVQGAADLKQNKNRLCCPNDDSSLIFYCR